MFNWDFLNNNLVFIAVVIWETFWKGLGLWKSAKRGDLVWFLAILLINLFGIIPIFYLWRTKQLEPALRDIKDFFKSKFKK